VASIGNSQGIVIPKPLLAQVGLEGVADMTIERDALVLRRPAKNVRSGWAAAGRKIADAGGDRLVVGEFGNDGDADLAWQRAGTSGWSHSIRTLQEVFAR
jgi:antitoxin MazE